MKKDQFNKDVCHTMGKCYTLLNAKASEYATDEDRLSAFKEAALLSKDTAESVAVSYMLKHIMSINDMSKRPWKYSTEMWDEKLCVAINYLLIIHALISERKSKTIADREKFMKLNSFYGLCTDVEAVAKVMKRRFENED